MNHDRQARFFHRLVRCAAACACVAVAAACTQVLGLDPPRRDPCDDGACVDASDIASQAPPPSGPAGHRGPVDAGQPGVTPPVADTGAGVIDASPPDAARMVRCGANSYCDERTQTCCAFDHNNGFTFGCIDLTSTCPGVPIGCATQSDCDPPSDCCVTNTFQSCVSRGTCPGDFVCDPKNGSRDCPNGTLCQPFPDPSIPYSSCR
jgi:hypothetical protein